MSIRMVFPHHWQTQRWKNGGGITHELLKDDQQPWRYRLSIAEINEDGPFSSFPGIDRIIMLLQGKGFELHFGGGHLQAFAAPFQPFPFRGEDDVQCELLNGPVRDFNVMVLREHVRAQAQVLTLDTQRQTLVAGSICHALFVLQGRAFVELNEHGYMMDAQHMLVAEQENGSLQLSALSPDTVVYSIAFDAKAA